MKEQLPKEIILFMAQRGMRMHHDLWHQIRENWYRLSEDERTAIAGRGWAPPRMAKNEKGWILDNNAGEDFLFMHHQMINLVNEKLREINDPHYPKVKGWETVPAPGDQDYPVPEFGGAIGDKDLDARLPEAKSDEYYFKTMSVWETKFKDPEYLKGVSLGQLGAELESTIHNNMHLRWSGTLHSASEKRPDAKPPYPENGVDEKWDDPSYDWLGDTYSSHVSPVFWKLHGWIDDRIEDWKKANNIQEINWQGQWEGPPPLVNNFFRLAFSAYMSAGHDHALMNMTEVRKILNRSGKCSHFYDDITLFDDVPTEEEQNEREALVRLVMQYLTKFSSDDRFIASLSHVLSTHTSFDKRYAIANAINRVMAGLDLEDVSVRAKIRQQLVDDVFNPETLLYGGLNIQRNWLLPFTFFGSMRYFSYNYAKSLQTAQSTAGEANPLTNAYTMNSTL